ncbi:MAG: hypothetical protein KC731_26850 [Myxococcales bacterium]|nr:hypothetical protein [Myxococcales bacterium]
MTRPNLAILLTAATAAIVACNTSPTDTEAFDERVARVQDELLGQGFAINTGSYSLHLEETLRFNSVRPGSDANSGRELFGLALDLETIDTTFGLFEGFSAAAGGVVTSNGRVCATCHRAQSLSFGMPPPPLDATIPLTDPLFTGIEADAQGDPDAFTNLNDHALFKYRPNRFNLARPDDDPFRKVFFWRKSPPLVNVVFSPGFLLDGRARVMFETDRGAVFSHTQSADIRFDDLFTLQNARDLEAFQFAQLSDPQLAALLDDAHPQHDYLASHPFATVPISTPKQAFGAAVFARDCFSCHNTPNVFNNRSNVLAIGDDPDRPPQFPPHAPNSGRHFNVGVSERNQHGLRFTVPVEGGGFEPVVLQLAKENGTVVMHTVTTDIGLAATTGRAADIGRFKVPQLRNIKNLGPYFHDNSADTLEEVVDYFNSDDYNHSSDGKKRPIHESPYERSALLAFLNLL